VYLNKHKLFSRNLVPALKLRTTSIKKIVDNREKHFLNYPEIVPLTHIDVRVMGLNDLRFSCIDLYITDLQKIILLI